MALLDGSDYSFAPKRQPVTTTEVTPPIKDERGNVWDSARQQWYDPKTTSYYSQGGYWTRDDGSYWDNSTNRWEQPLGAADLPAFDVAATNYYDPKIAAEDLPAFDVAATNVWDQQMAKPANLGLGASKWFTQQGVSDPTQGDVWNVASRGETPQEKAARAEAGRSFLRDYDAAQQRDYQIRRAQQQIDQQRALGNRFLPPSTGQKGRSNWIERNVTGPISDILGGAAKKGLSAASQITSNTTGPVAAGMYHLGENAGKVTKNLISEIMNPGQMARGTPGDGGKLGPMSYTPPPVVQRLGEGVSTETYHPQAAYKGFLANDEIPWAVRMGVDAALDPTNLIGAGIGTKALRSGQAMGKISTLLAKADRAADVGQMALAKPVVGGIAGILANEAYGQPVEWWQAGLGGAALGVAGPKVLPKVAGPVAKGVSKVGGVIPTGGIGATNRVMAGETGGVPASIAARAGFVAGAGMAGYGAGALGGQDEGDRRNTGMVAAGLMAGIVGAKVPAKTVGAGLKKIGMTGALGRQPEWLTKLPLAYEQSKTVIPLPSFDTAPLKLPVKARIKNVIIDAAAHIHPDLLKRLNVPGVSAIAESLKAGDAPVNKVAKTAGLRFEYTIRKAGVVVDEGGYVLGKNGEQLPVFDKDGSVMMIMDEVTGETRPLLGASLAQVREQLGWYRGYLDDAQLDGIRSAFDELVAIVRPAQDTLAIAPEDTTKIILGPEGAYAPRGVPRRADADITPLSWRRMNKVEGAEPGASRSRGFLTSAHAAEEKMIYPQPYELATRYVGEALDEVNVQHHVNELVKLPGPDGKPLGAHISGAEQEQLRALIRETRPDERHLRKLTIAERRVERDLKLTARQIEVDRNRVQALEEMLGEQTGRAAEKKAAAEEAIRITKEHIDATVGRVSDMVNALEKSLPEAESVRAELAKLRGQATGLRNKIRAAEARATAVEAGTEMLQQTVGQPGAWLPSSFFDEAAKLREDALRIASEAEAKMLDIPVGETSQRLALARMAAQEAKTALRESVADIVRSGKALAKETGTKRGAAVAPAKTTGRLAERGKTLARGAHREEVLQKQAVELEAKAEKLRETLAPYQEQKKVLRDQIQAARAIGKQRGWDAEVPLGPLQGVKFPRDVANAVSEIVNMPPGKPGIGTVAIEIFNGMFRSLGAGLDLAGPGTVNLLGLSSRGQAWRALGPGFRSVKNADAFVEKMIEVDTWARSQGLPPLHEAVVYIESAPSEVMVGGGQEMIIRGARKPARTSATERIANLPGYKQSGEFFSVPQNVMRVLTMYDELLRLKGAGVDIADRRVLEQVGNAANIISGRSRRAFAEELGKGPAQQAWFAGRFLRSQVETVMNAMFSGGIEGDISREALIKLAGVGALTAYVVNTTQGNEHDWSNPFEFRLGDRDVNLLGPWDSLMKGVLKMQEGIRSGDWNDSTYLVRTKASPLVSFFWNLGEGTNVFGEEIGRPVGPGFRQFWSDPEAVLQLLPMPFTLRNGLADARDVDWDDGVSIASWLFGLGTGVMGLKSSPLTAYEQWDRDFRQWAKGLPDEYYIAHGMKPEDGRDVGYGDAPEFLKRVFREAYDGKPLARDKTWRRVQELGEEEERKKDALGEKFMDPDQAQSLGDYLDGKRRVQDTFRGQREEALKGEKDREIEDERYRTYLELFEKSKDPETGLTDYEKFDKLEGEWLAKYGEEGMRYIQAVGLVGENEVETKRRTALNALATDGYFDREKMPRYRNLKSGTGEEELEKLEAEVSRKLGWLREDAGVPSSELEWMEGAPYILRQMGVSKEVGHDIIAVHVADSVRRTLQQGKRPANENEWWLNYLSPDFFKYQQSHKVQLAWLDHSNTYIDILRAEMRGQPIVP